MVLLVATTLLAQQLESLSGPQTANIAKLVCEMLQANHISHKPINDDISSKMLDEFIKMLDSQKLYFLQSDIDRFNKYRLELDDLVKAGNVDFAGMAHDTLQQRLKERMAVAHTLIDSPHDFTVQETLDIDAKDLPWASTVEVLNERWRKQIKYQLLLIRLEKGLAAEGSAGGHEDKPKDEVKPNPDGKKPVEQDPLKRLHKRYKAIYDNLSKVEPDEIVELYLTSLCLAYDPHSSYMSPRSVREFQIMMSLKLDGIGAALQAEDGYTVVNKIVPAGAAADDGRLKINDKIVAVGNGNAEFVDVVDMKLSKVVDMIRGKAGTKVRLKVMTAATSEVQIYELIRKQVELKSSEVKGEIIDVSTRLKGTKGRIGIVHLPSFYRDFQAAENREGEFKSAARDVKKVLRDFQTQGGVDAVIVDLRYNGGGALKEAIDVSGLFIKDGPVVAVKDQQGEIEVHNDEESTLECDKPLVVITNRLSASASEIFAGMIKDYGRGLLVGDRTTHGKGTVQNVANVGRKLQRLLGAPELGALKLTIQQFYRVNGHSTQQLGVWSDIALPSLMDNMDLGEQFLDNALPFDQIAEMRHRRIAMVPADLTEIRSMSYKRLAASTDFQKTEKDIERFLARKQRKAVSLNEDELRKERVEEEQKTRDKAESSDDLTDGAPIFPDNSYNNEVLSITLDYLKQLGEPKTAKK
ncbi:MAG: tail-specific protease [Planctomycetaceae bacterium]|nr:tail-specific protease [Planctomycetaceae bacterium]